MYYQYIRKQLPDVHIIAVGGITLGCRMQIEKINAGANLVQVYTGLFMRDLQ